jgi:hypothetical protein
VIYVEDLNTMQTRDLGKTWNARLGGHVRALVFAAMKDAASKVGIAVVSVPARGTSAGCPRCNAKVKHVKAPDRPTKSGHKWSVCQCGLSQDRDHAAAERILARGLLGQDHTQRTRTGDLHIRTTLDGPVTHPVHDKKTRTPRRRLRVPQRLTHRVPLRRTAPAPAPAGQRPAGRTPQGSPQVPRTKVIRHRPHGWRRGSGFAWLVQADPVHRFT